MLPHTFLSPSWITVTGAAMGIRPTPQQETFQCVIALMTRHGGSRFFYYLKRIIMIMYAILYVWIAE